MPPKNMLRDLLQQDQEPFHLPDYIAHRRTSLSTSTGQLHQTRYNINKNCNSSTLTFCRNACCFSVKHRTPDANAIDSSSPLSYFHKRHVKLLHIPSKTAALLLEAALRIHNHSSRKTFGPVFNKLTLKTQMQGLRPSSVPQVQNNSRQDASVSRKRDSMDLEEPLSDTDMGFCYNGRRSCSSNSDATQFVGEQIQSPSRRCSPDLSFHPLSPSRCAVKDEDEEEKEQCSPVCVLDPLFEEEDGTNENDGDDYDVECSYANVQGQKNQLFNKLCRFETQANLDSKQLREMILEDELESERLEEKEDIASQISAVPADEILQQVLEKSGFHDLCGIPIDLKILISDVIEDQEMKCAQLDDIINTVRAMLNSWKEVEANTIDMMLEQDLKLKSNRWQRNQEQVTKAGLDIEFAIFGSLVNELFM